MSVALPASIQRKVRRIAVRRRLVALLAEAGRATAVSAAIWLAACLIDRLLPLPGLARLCILLLGLAVPGAALAVVLRRALGRLDWLDESARIERSHRVLDQRLQTVVSQGLSDARYRGSERMLQQLTEEVERQMRRIRPSRTVPLRRAAAPWCLVGAVLTLGGLLLPIEPLGLRLLLDRLLLPLGDQLPVTSTRLAVDPGDIAILAGEAITVRVSAVRLGGGGVDLYTSADGRSWTQHLMNAVDARTFVHRIDAVKRTIRYYASGGDATSRVYRITVARRPEVLELRARAEYPNYLGMPPQTLTATDGAFEAPAGTQLTLEVLSSEPLAWAALTSGAQRLPFAPGENPRIWQLDLRADRDHNWNLETHSSAGLDGRTTRVTIRAVPDRPPAVRLLSPTADLMLHSRDVLPLIYQAVDDRGLGAAWVLAHVHGQPAREFPIALGPDPRRLEGRFDLDLAAIGAKLLDVVTISVWAQDRCDATPPTERRSASESRHVLVAPRSTDRDAGHAVAELRRAAAAAASLAGRLTQAAEVALKPPARTESPPVDPGAQVVRIGQLLSMASDDAVALHEAILASIARGRSAHVATALATWLDRGLVITALAQEVRARTLASSSPDPRLLRQLQQSDADALARALKTLAEGDQADLLLGDLVDLRSAPNRPGDSRLADTLRALQRQMESAANELGLRSTAADFEQQLRRRADSGQAVARAEAPVDFAGAARQWTQTKPVERATADLDDRMAAAALAESLRADSDVVWVRDLRLLTRAARALQAEGPAERPAATAPTSAPALDYPEIVAALQQSHLARRRARPDPQIEASADAARRSLITWLNASSDTRPSTDELLAEANVATMARDFAAAAAADRELDQAMRAAATQRSGAAADRFDPRTIAQQMERLARLDKLLQWQADLARRAAAGEPAYDLSVAQRHLAQAIAAFDAQSERSPGLHADDAARQSAFNAVDRTMQLAAKLPQQAADVRPLADALKQAEDRLAQAQREAANARGPSRNLIRAVEQARAEVKTASARLGVALEGLTTAADDVSRQLDAIGSDAVQAQAMGQSQLKPAVAAYAAAVRAGDPAAAARAMTQIRDATARLPALLAGVPDALARRYPLSAAAYQALQAAAALEAPTPPAQTIARQQQSAASALRLALDRATRDAIAMRQSALSVGVRGAATIEAVAGPGPRGPRRWGRLEARPSDPLSAPSSQTDWPMFEEPLRAYFEALRKAHLEQKRVAP